MPRPFPGGGCSRGNRIEGCRPDPADRRRARPSNRQKPPGPLPSLPALRRPRRHPCGGTRGDAVPARGPGRLDPGPRPAGLWASRPSRIALACGTSCSRSPPASAGRTCPGPRGSRAPATATHSGGAPAFPARHASCRHERSGHRPHSSGSWGRLRQRRAAPGSGGT